MPETKHSSTGPRASDTGTRAVRSRLAALRKLAATDPQALLPHLTELAGLLDSASSSVQQGSLEILVLISKVAPDTLAFILPRLHDLLANEPRNAAARRAVEILANYARGGQAQAGAVLRIFAATIDRVGVRPAAAMLTSITKVAAEMPALGKRAAVLGRRFERSLAVTLRQAARRLARLGER